MSTIGRPKLLDLPKRMIKLPEAFFNIPTAFS